MSGGRCPALDPPPNRHQGNPPDLALTLGHAVAGPGARAKAPAIGIADEKDDQSVKRAFELRRAIEPVRLLGRDIQLRATDDGEPRADDKGKPGSAAGVRRYLAKAFGDRLDWVRAAMETLAASLPPDDLNRGGFGLYEAFRPEVPQGAEGWGAKCLLHIDRIVRAAEPCA